MIRARMKYGVGITTALLLLAGVATASPIALFEGGGEAAAEAAGGYHADASGALDAANDGAASVHDQANQAYQSTNSAYEGARSQVWETVDATDAPAMPECACNELADQLDQVGDLEASHADSLSKSADLENEYVDAGVDASAAGSMRAWLSDVVDGAQDAFRAIESLFKVDTTAAEDAKSATKDLRNADDELRSQVGDLLAQEHDLPSVNPRLDGEMSAEHATGITSSALGQVQGDIP